MALNAEEVNKIFVATTQICKAKQHSLIDAIFENAPVEEMPQQIMEVYMDATWNYKPMFKNREIFFDKCKNALEKRGEKMSRKLIKLL